MDRPPFFLCAPRTRSSILFETMMYWANDYYGLLPLHNHMELFLEISKNVLAHDAKTEKSFETELHPVVRPDGIHVHYIWPPMFNNSVERNSYKLNVLEELRDQGKHYNIKGTINLIHTAEQAVEFFSDRHFVITKRRSIVDNTVSFAYAYMSKLFSARKNNMQLYLDKLEQGVTIPQQLLDRIPNHIKEMKQLEDMELLLEKKGIPYSIVYYEDMNTEEQIDQTITDLYDTNSWKASLPDNIADLQTIHVEKDYSKVIKNYDQLVEYINRAIKGVAT